MKNSLSSLRQFASISVMSLLALTSIATTAQDQPANTNSTAAISAAPPEFGYVIVWVKDVDLAQDFYWRVFQLSVKRQQDMVSFKWLEMQTGTTTLAFAGEQEIKSMFPNGYARNGLATSPVAAQLSFVTPDVKAVYERALAAGAVGLRSPVLMPWGQVWGQLRDPNGVLVSIASPMTK